MNMPVFRRRQTTQISAAARAVAQRTPVSLTVARQRAQPAAVTIVRLASTAVFAYLVALLLPVTSRPVLAPLTALLVIQVTLYQTLRSAVRRVGAVVSGVLLAVALSSWVGFTWWSLGLTIAVALADGYALHLGDSVLEVPISAMLILSVDTHSAGTWRIVETLVGRAPGWWPGSSSPGRACSRPRGHPGAVPQDDRPADRRQPPGRIGPRTSGRLARPGPLAERRDPARGRRAPRGGGERAAESARLRLPYAA